MRETAAGYFRCPNRFPGGRGTGGQPASEDAVRLSVSAGMFGGQELHRCVLQFGLGLSGPQDAFGPRCGPDLGIQEGGPRETPRVTKPKWDQDQDGPMARAEGGVPGALSSADSRLDSLTIVYCSNIRAGLLNGGVMAP